MLLGHQVFKLRAKRIKLNLLLQLSILNSHFTLPLAYLNPALNNLAPGSVCHIEFNGVHGRVWVMKCTITGGYFTWLRAESVLQNTSLFFEIQPVSIFSAFPILIGNTADQSKRGRTKMASKQLQNRKKTNSLWAFFPQ